ncbi:unnamed protein product, partial [Polarella glacialis]
WDDISSAAKDLVRQLMTVDPRQRPNIKEVLSQTWLHEESECVEPFSKRPRLDSETGLTVTVTVDSETDVDGGQQQQQQQQQQTITTITNNNNSVDKRPLLDSETVAGGACSTPPMSTGLALGPLAASEVRETVII